MDQVLYDAARLLDESGHQKGTFTNITEDAFCVEGAVRQAKYGTVYISDSQDMDVWNHLKRVVDVIDPRGLRQRSAIYLFNDHPDRTKEECVKVLMEAAEKE